MRTLSLWIVIVVLVPSRSYRAMFTMAGEQVTVYEAGVTEWARDGDVALVPRTNLDSFCPPSQDNDGVSDDDHNPRAAFILSGSSDLVSLPFNGM